MFLRSQGFIALFFPRGPLRGPPGSPSKSKVAGFGDLHSPGSPRSGLAWLGWLGLAGLWLFGLGLAGF